MTGRKIALPDPPDRVWQTWESPRAPWSARSELERAGDSGLAGDEHRDGPVGVGLVVGNVGCRPGRAATGPARWYNPDVSSIDRGFWGGTVAELERLAGPLQQGPASVSAFDVLEGTYRGHRLRASWLGRIRSGTAPPGSTLRLGLSLGDRPIRTYVWSRKGSSIFGPTATTGDPVFDDRYIAAAIPSEVVSAAFDAEVRAMIDRRWNGRDTSLDASDGWVSIAAGRSTPGLAGSATPPTPEELGQVLDDLVLVAARLIAAYDTRRRRGRRRRSRSRRAVGTGCPRRRQPRQHEISRPRAGRGGDTARGDGPDRGRGARRQLKRRQPVPNACRSRRLQPPGGGARSRPWPSAPCRSRGG